jgi:hypothetical protein
MKPCAFKYRRTTVLAVDDLSNWNTDNGRNLTFIANPASHFHDRV